MDETSLQTIPDPGAAPASPAASEPTGAPPTPAAAPPTPPPAPEPSGQPGAPSSGQPPVPGTPPPPPATDWSFRADREQHTIPGARVAPDGSLTIPANQVATIRQLLAEGIAHRGSWQEERGQYEARIAELEQAVEQHPDVLRARAFNERLLALMAQGPEAMAAWLDQFEANRPALLAQAEQAVLQQRLEAAERERTTLAEQYEADRLAPQIEASLQGAVEELAARPEFQSVNAGALYSRLMEHYLNRVCYEVPATQRRMGLKAGEVLIGQSRDGQKLYVLDRGLIEDEFRHWATLSGGAASAARTAVAQNAAALAAGAPPVPVGQGGPAQPGPQTPVPKTKEELDKWFETGAWRQTFPTPGVG
jgi:hypothetical protein